MSTPDPAIATAARKPSLASRYFFVFLVGLVIGAIGVVMLLRTLDARKTPQDRWHDAAMNILAVQMGRAQGNVEQNRCAATDVIPPLQAMRSLANDLEPAFPDLADDKRFQQHAAQFRSSLDATLASPPINCAGAGAALKKIGEDCSACHRDFRG